MLVLVLLTLILVPVLIKLALVLLTLVLFPLPMNTLLLSPTTFSFFPLELTLLLPDTPKHIPINTIRSVIKLICLSFIIVGFFFAGDGGNRSISDAFYIIVLWGHDQITIFGP